MASALPKMFREAEPPSPTGVSASEDGGGGRRRTLLWKKRHSEWAFRPLKLKFKVKELESLYKNYIYKQQQSLLFSACMLLGILAILVFIGFLSRRRVRRGGEGGRGRRTSW